MCRHYHRRQFLLHLENPVKRCDLHRHHLHKWLLNLKFHLANHRLRRLLFRQQVNPVVLLEKHLRHRLLILDYLHFAYYLSVLHRQNYLEVEKLVVYYLHRLKPL
jgi:hypothetical protein